MLDKQNSKCLPNMYNVFAFGHGLRCEMFISIHIKKPVHMNSMFLKDANLNFKYSRSLRN